VGDLPSIGTFHASSLHAHAACLCFTGEVEQVFQRGGRCMLSLVSKHSLFQASNCRTLQLSKLHHHQTKPAWTGQALIGQQTEASLHHAYMHARTHARRRSSNRNSTNTNCRHPGPSYLACCLAWLEADKAAARNGARFELTSSLKQEMVVLLRDPTTCSSRQKDLQPMSTIIKIQATAPLQALDFTYVSSRKDADVGVALDQGSG
jgi:hypothetical protein